MKECICHRTPCVCPKFSTYAVVEAHTGEVVSKHKTRALANASVTSFSQRVRGHRP